ncbi:MAG: hypothetical protein WD068_01775 [Candidatus Babeliales bacterium]
MIKKLSLLLLFLMVQMPIQANWWDSCKEFYQKYKAKFEEGIEPGFNEAGRYLPTALIATTFRVIQDIIRNRSTKSNELYEQNRLLIIKQQYFGVLEEKLHDQKEELDREWEQLIEDAQEIARMEECIKKKQSAGHAKITNLFSRYILGKQEVPVSSEEVQQLMDDVAQLKAFYNKQKESHLKKRQRLADMIDAYQEHYSKFVQATAQAEEAVSK